MAKNILKEPKKTDSDSCSDLFGECDFSLGLSCQGTTGSKTCM